MACRLPDAESSLLATFERIAAVHGSNRALRSAGWRASYAELNAMANRLAHAMLRAGGEPQDRVAILMRHDTPLIAAVLAVLKVGRIVVVLNPNDPPTRLGQLIEDSEPSAVFADQNTRTLAGKIAPVGSRLHVFEDYTADTATDNIGLEIKPDYVAYIAYTSGSSGPPKGVMVLHRQLRGQPGSMPDAMKLRDTDRILLLGALTGGQGMSSVSRALFAGAEILPFPVMEKGFTGLAAWMLEQDVTVYWSSASLFRQFMRTLSAASTAVSFPSVRNVRLASEPANSEDFKHFIKHFPNATFVHTMASSETSLMAFHRVDRNEALPEGRLPVGHPPASVEILLLDDQGQAVKPGAVGEVFVKSPLLSQGYWKNEALTAQRFIEPSDGSGIRTFRTGDLARRDAEGMLHFIGRKADRIKIRGYRIEPPEIENAISSLPEIETAVVSVWPRDNEDLQLVAYVKARDGRVTSAGTLRRKLATVLPRYMAPSTFIFVENFPLNAHGKIDRARLTREFPPAHDPGRGELPATQGELELASIWKEALEVHDIFRNDDFFDLGGDSLRAATVAASVHAATGVSLNLGAFFDTPVFADLAALIDRLRVDAEPVEAETLPAVPRGKTRPLSFEEEPLWRISQQLALSANYTATTAYRLYGPLDPEILRRCVAYMTGRHEILRTGYTTANGEAAAVIHAGLDRNFEVIDLTTSPDGPSEVEAIAETMASRIYKVDEPPLWHMKLLRLSETEHMLLRSAHHIFYDSASWHIFFQEIASLYEAAIKGEAPPLPASEPVQYADYATWQRARLCPDGKLVRESVAWWREELQAPPPALKLPCRRWWRAKNAAVADGVIDWTLDAPLAEALNEQCREQGITPYIFRLTAFAAWMFLETGQRDFVIGTYITQRGRLPVRGMFGFFANLVMLRFRFENSMTFMDCLSMVRQSLVRAEAHSDMPFEMLRGELRSAGVKAPPIKVFYKDDRPPTVLRFAELELKQLVRKTETMPWHFSFGFIERDGKQRGWSHFDAHLHDPERVRQLVERFRHLLTAAAGQPDVVLDELRPAGPRKTNWPRLPIRFGARLKVRSI